ncbi:hypothetical protein BG015_009684 [Linnemannia schmuckeri]|uniref:Xylanolytic transcriptional activator regulatory domain-containing protein n=1 Tax=Linnemannia schmuckeri TaxID=64567 RepID=A0A9P5S5I9_9FUNG|nr:hypothetical protein BG015_009684 [Linnemannia schmuckeri]
MEGLLGGLVKDKDPRAEIVRAELDAMAREAEMTGLKLRRSKAYEELTYAMGISTSNSSTAESKSNAPTVKKESIVSDASPMDRQPHQQQSKSSPSSSSYSEHISTSQQQPQLQPQHFHPYRSQQPPQTQKTQQSGNQNHHQQQPGHYNNYQQHCRNGSGSGAANISLSPPTDGQSAPTFMSTSSSVQQYQYQPHHPPQQPVSQFHSHSSQSSPGHHAHQQHSNPGSWQHYQHPTHQQHPGAAYESLAVSHRYHSSSSATETYPPASWTGNERNGSGSMFTSRKESDVVYRPLGLDRPTHVDPLTGYMAMPRQVVPQESRLVLPSSEVMDHLFDIHFRFVHPVLPMLHRKTFYDQIHGPEPPPAHLLFAVLGLASRFSDNPVFRTPQPGADRPPCTIFYERAKELIKEEYDNSQVGTVQALLLMAIQQMGFCESQRAWLYVGMAIRMAQDLGLNCELSEQEQIRNPVVAEQRRRTWWSCYVVERLVCAGLGRPLSITQQHCETGFPRYDEPEPEIGLPDGSLVGCVGIASNFVLLITLSSIQGNILQFIKARAVRNDDHRQSHEGSPSHPTLSSTSDQDRAYRVDTSPAAFAALDRSLTEWRQRLPAALQSPTSDSPHYGLFLHMTYNTLIILLHRPEVFYSATSASLCTEAAAAITEITELLMRANALTSMIISCLYAIFSAGLIHFINIPSAKRGSVPSNYSSPTLSSTRPAVAMYSPASGPAALAAKTNMKRCIDALKFLSSHWVSAARRAKVLEDLLDLKKVCLKDLEVDSFQTTPLMPDWVVESIKYGQALAVPREGHDQLRQKCRSKMMAIQSLLANDEEYDRMQNRRSSSVDEPMGNGDKNEESMDITQESVADDRSRYRPVYSEDWIQSFSGSSTSASSSPILSRGSQSQKQSYSFGSDPMMLISTATFGPSGAQTPVPEANTMDVEVLGGMRSFTPMTLTTLGYTSPTASSSASPATSRYARHGSVTATAKSPATSLTSASKATMLDPFSMPSSITFPEASHGRQSSYGSGVDSMEGMGGGDSPGGSIFRRDGQDDKNRIPSSFQRMSLAGGSSPSHSSSCGDEHEQDEHDVIWSDMPPTLGLDEWMAYIGALMMRWLASGETKIQSNVERIRQRQHFYRQRRQAMATYDQDLQQRSSVIPNDVKGRTQSALSARYRKSLHDDEKSSSLFPKKEVDREDVKTRDVHQARPQDPFSTTVLSSRASLAIERSTQGDTNLVASGLDHYQSARLECLKMLTSPTFDWLGKKYQLRPSELLERNSTPSNQTTREQSKGVYKSFAGRRVGQEGRVQGAGDDDYVGYSQNDSYADDEDEDDEDEPLQVPTKHKAVCQALRTKWRRTEIVADGAIIKRQESSKEEPIIDNPPHAADIKMEPDQNIATHVNEASLERGCTSVYSATGPLAAEHQAVDLTNRSDILDRATSSRAADPSAVTRAPHALVLLALTQSSTSVDHPMPVAKETQVQAETSSQARQSLSNGPRITELQEPFTKDLTETEKRSLGTRIEDMSTAALLTKDARVAGLHAMNVNPATDDETGPQSTEPLIIEKPAIAPQPTRSSMANVMSSTPHAVEPAVAQSPSVEVSSAEARPAGTPALHTVSPSRPADTPSAAHGTVNLPDRRLDDKFEATNVQETEQKPVEMYSQSIPSEMHVLLYSDDGETPFQNKNHNSTSAYNKRVNNSGSNHKGDYVEADDISPEVSTQYTLSMQSSIVSATPDWLPANQEQAARISFQEPLSLQVQEQRSCQSTLTRSNASNPHSINYANNSGYHFDDCNFHSDSSSQRRPRCVHAQERQNSPLIRLPSDPRDMNAWSPMLGSQDVFENIRCGDIGRSAGGSAIQGVRNACDLGESAEDGEDDALSEWIHDDEW